MCRWRLHALFYFLKQFMGLGFLPLTLFNWKDMVRLFVNINLSNAGKYLRKVDFYLFMSNEFDSKRVLQQDAIRPLANHTLVPVWKGVPCVGGWGGWGKGWGAGPCTEGSKLHKRCLHGELHCIMGNGHILLVKRQTDTHN